MPIIDKRVCNALIQNGEPDFALAHIVAAGLGAEDSVNSTEIVLKIFKQFHGGLWVGGNASLTEDAVSFKPNMLNRMVHKGDPAYHRASANFRRR